MFYKSIKFIVPILICSATVATTSKKEDVKQEHEVKVKVLTENEAINIALLDLYQIPDSERKYIRYIWLTDSELTSARAISLTLNLVSRGTVIVRPSNIANLLIRVDLRYYLLNPEIWEEFRFDPRFNQLITKGEEKIKCEPYEADDGKIYNYKFIEKDVIRKLSPHINQKPYEALVTITGSKAPIVNHQYFITRALSTIQNKGVAKVLYSGLYYQLIGVKKK